MQLLTIDFETFFSNDYSLSRKEYNTESYIRSPLFKAHGASIRWPNGSIEWWTGARLPALFGAINWGQTAVLAQHAQFESLILSHHYGAHPAFWFDTRAMGNLLLPRHKKSLSAMAAFYELPEKTVPYNLFRGIRELPFDIEREVAAGCSHDVLLNYTIFQKMLRGEKGLPPFPQSELPIISETIKMFGSPILHIDIGRAEALAGRIAARKELTLEALGVDKEILSSRECFAELLREQGVEPPTKISLTTKLPTYAFGKNDACMKALLESDNESIVALVAARLGVSSTIGETRARRYAATGHRGQPVPVYLNYAATFSTRWGGGDSMNWQNLERLPNKIDGQYETGPDGHVRKGETRLCILAPPGYKLVIVDLSQIEARTLAWHAGQEDLLETFRDPKRDVYSEFIEPYYGYPVSKATPSERGVGKVSILQMGYQAGDLSIQATMALGSYGPPIKLTLTESRSLKDYYRGRNHRIVAHWEKAGWMIEALATKQHIQWGPVTIDNGRVWLPNNVWLDYSTLYRGEPPEGKIRGDWMLRTRKGAEKIYSGKITAHVNSALARVVMTNAMVKIAPRYKIALTVHDELVLCVPTEQAEDAKAFALETMTTIEPWMQGLPVAAEAHISEVYDK